MKKILGIALLVVVCGCQSGPTDVIQKVKYDFGIGEKPEGYVSGTDRVMENLRKVGEIELKRMNMEGRHGEVKFESGDGGLSGKYFKEVREYDNFYPLDAQPVSKAAHGDRGYMGYIEYSYRVYQSPRFSNRTEAAAASASIPTNMQGRDVYKYRFNSGGYWDQAEGELTRQ